MKLAFYVPLKSNGVINLNQMVENLKAGSDLEIYRSIESLAERLCQPGKDAIVTVIVAASQEALQEVVSIKELLFNLKIILVLPDRESETVATGHMLRPRFITYTDCDPVDIHAVIDKMMGNCPEGSNSTKADKSTL